jgi:hypothetical protein
MGESSAPEFNAEIALEIVRKHQQLDNETFDKETGEDIPYSDTKLEKQLNVDPSEIKKSKRKDTYVVNNEEEKVELKHALNYLFEGNSVHYKKRIVVKN